MKSGRKMIFYFKPDCCYSHYEGGKLEIYVFHGTYIIPHNTQNGLYAEYGIDLQLSIFSPLASIREKKNGEYRRAR